ncbi:hypothetical protein EDB85DRAFT_1893160 [Lactarius pseudohatsudake]|nr:hypothetical protein EDB85DRAFT_1893160 [Lactarius pseudohatsudake]
MKTRLTTSWGLAQVWPGDQNTPNRLATCESIAAASTLRHRHPVTACKTHHDIPALRSSSPYRYRYCSTARKPVAAAFTLHYMGVRHPVTARKARHDATSHNTPRRRMKSHCNINCDRATTTATLQPCADNNRRRWDVAGHKVSASRSRLSHLVLKMIICVGRKLGMVTEIPIQMPPMCEKWLLGDFFIPSFQCPRHVERVGVLGDGGKGVCGMGRNAEQEKMSSTRSVARAGTNSESSFEVALLERAQGREVWGYDFTIDSFSPEIEKTPNPKKRGRNAHGPEDSPKSYTPERPQDGRLERSPPVVEQVKFAPYCPIGSVVLENGLSGLCVARNAVSVSNSAPSASFLSTSMNVWPKFPHEIRSLVNYNAGGKPRLAEYSFLNIRGDHSLVYEAADGADAY